MNPAWARTAIPLIAGAILSLLITNIPQLANIIGELEVLGIDQAVIVTGLAAVLGYLYHLVAVWLGKRFPWAETILLGSTLRPNYIASKHRYGYVPDVKDVRDYQLGALTAGKFAASVSLRSKMPPIYDQGQLGSCTANSAAAIYDYERSLQGLKFLRPSRLFIYWFTRFIEGTTSTDSGGQIRDAIKAMRLYGVVAERRWPYVISQFTKRPSNALVLAAKRDVVVKQYAVPQSEAGLKAVLNAVPPRPINFGFTCYPDLESAAVAKTGILPLPAPDQQSIGGHAVDVIGYKQINGQDYYEIRNSWGKKWGDHGHFWMPAAYILNPSLASDFWVVQAVSQSAA